MELVDKIRNALLEGRFDPGASLSQSELAKTFGVSRIPVRDALQILASEKLVEVVPGKGAKVVSVTADDLNELFDLRLHLECDLLTRAMENLNASAVREAEYAFQKSSLEAGRPGWQSGDWLFHHTLYEPASRARQVSIIKELRAGCSLYAGGYGNLADNTDKWIADHKALLQAYSNGEANEAHAILERHILEARDHLLAR